MKRMIALAIVSLALSGCMTPEQWAYVKQPPGVVAQTPAPDVDPFNASIRANAEQARSAFLKANPTDPYSDAIAKGYLQRGMTLEEIEAAGFFCDMKEQSDIGSVYSCKSLAMETSEIPEDQMHAEYVGFNSEGKVESIQY